MRHAFVNNTRSAEKERGRAYSRSSTPLEQPGTDHDIGIEGLRVERRVVGRPDPRAALHAHAR